MLTFQTGSEFMGFGPYMECPKCKNKVLMRINEEYVKSGVLYMPIVSKHGKIFMQCGTCETAWKLEKEEAIPLLEEGMETTKKYLMKIDSSTRKAVLKRLNKWGAHDLVVYYGSE